MKELILVLLFIVVFLGGLHEYLTIGQTGLILISGAFAFSVDEINT